MFKQTTKIYLTHSAILAASHSGSDVYTVPTANKHIESFQKLGIQLCLDDLIIVLIVFVVSQGRFQQVVQSFLGQHFGKEIGDVVGS